MINYSELTAFDILNDLEYLSKCNRWLQKIFIIPSDFYFSQKKNSYVLVYVKVSVHDGTQVPATWNWNQKLSNIRQLKGNIGHF